MSWKTWAAAIGSSIFLGACAGWSQLPAIHEGASVALEVTASASPGGAPAIENRALGQDASTGYKVGAVTFGLWGLACGPFAVICVPTAAGLGALTGAVAGAGVGLTGALSPEKAARLQGRLQQSLQKHPPVDELRQSATDLARQHWRVGEPQANETVTIELQELVLTSTRDEQIGFAATVRVRTRHGPNGPVTEKVYPYVGPSTSLAVWLDERYDFVEASIKFAMQHLAAQIVSDLARA
jgi:hypothetical protein